MPSVRTAGVRRFFNTAFCCASLCGLIQVAQAQTYSILHRFAGKPADGAFGVELTADSAGNFYGVTVEGGQNGLGTVFKMDPNRNVTILHSFATGTQGGLPDGGLLRDGKG